MNVEVGVRRGRGGDGDVICVVSYHRQHCTCTTITITQYNTTVDFSKHSQQHPSLTTAHSLVASSRFTTSHKLSFAIIYKNLRMYEILH